MAGPEVIERLIAAAFKQSGDRLELRQDRAAVMVRGAERLRAGAIETNLETLVGWWREVAPPDLALPEAGGDGTVSAELDRGGRPVTVKAFTAPMGLDESGVADLYQKVEDISSQSEIRDENMGKKAVDRTILLKSGKPLQLQIEKDKLEEQAYALAY